MKNKILILSLLMAGAATTATAQTKEKFTSEKAGDNIFISVGVGAQVKTTDDTMDHFGSALTPKFSVSLGKWINPVWGFRGQVSGWKSRMYSDYNNGTADVEKGILSYGDELKYKKNYISANADALLNLSHLIGGYNPDRIFNLSVFAGPGFNFAKGYDNIHTVYNTNESTGVTTWKRESESGSLRALVSGSAGLLGQFNVSRFWDINVEVRGEVGATPYKISRSYTDGTLSATVGASYTFGGKKFVSCGAKVDQDAINAEINKYRRALAEAEEELARTKNALANAKGQTKEVVKEIEIAGPRAVFFQIGKSVIDDYGKVNIQLAAKTIKANPNKKYKIAGYADKATGSANFNQKLTEKRAQAVYDALIAEGVSSSQLEMIGYGGTENMFGKNMLNRVVILE